MAIGEETIRMILDMGASGATVADVQQKLEGLAQGGLAGILHNIDGLTMALAKDTSAQMAEVHAQVENVRRAFQELASCRPTMKRSG